jgi:CheY-like chemotaxis protein
LRGLGAGRPASFPGDEATLPSLVLPPKEATILKILIAEDETLIRLDLHAILERHGFTVCAEARDGLEAVELARSTCPDAAILDMRMPHLDGIEAARRMYAERPLPIVMLTAFRDKRTVERAVEAGVFGYLLKPFREGDIAPALHAAVARHRELLGARRRIGFDGSRQIQVWLPSPSGSIWPLRIDRNEDGSIEVRGGAA